MEKPGPESGRRAPASDLARFTARSGAPSLRIDGAALHSPYDPAREAARFVETALAGENPSTVVLLGEGLGYATEALAGRLPSARLIRIFYDERVYRLCPDSGHPSWHPGSPASLEAFLRENIGELDMEGLRPLEWQPSAAAFPEASRTAHRALRQVLQELNGSLVTTLSAGKLWIRNSVENFVCLEAALRGPPCAPGRPVIVAASGPSLERAGSLIRASRQRLDLWALPSAFPFLAHAGLAPDLVVMTDPSHWSMLHLQFPRPSCPVAMPLSAARGLWRLPEAAPLLLCQPSFFEEELLAAAGEAGALAPRIAPHGTVAATALDLALASTTGPVIAAGLDMRAEDIFTHCRPNAFESFLGLRDSRTAPLHGRLFARAAAQEVEREHENGRTVRHLRSLRTYAGWFSEPSPLDRGRLFRLLPTTVLLPRLRNLDGEGLAALTAACRQRGAGGCRLRTDPSFPDRGARLGIARAALERWAGAVEKGRAGLGTDAGLAAFTLSPLLLPLAYHVDARGLLDARRKARAGDAGRALEAGARVLDGCASFLEALEAKLRRA